MASPNHFKTAILVAKKAHREYDKQPWFKGTKLYQADDKVAVKVLCDSQYFELQVNKFEDGVLVTFGEA